MFRTSTCVCVCAGQHPHESIQKLYGQYFHHMAIPKPVSILMKNTLEKKNIVVGRHRWPVGTTFAFAK